MSTPRQRFVDLLRRDILEIDAAELDFGIYRALNHRRATVDRVPKEELPARIEAALARLPGRAGGDVEARLARAGDAAAAHRHAGPAHAGSGRRPMRRVRGFADLEVASLWLPVRAALVTATLPEHMAVPPGMQAAASLSTARVLRHSDAQHIDQLMNHLRAALGAPAAP